MPSTKDLKWMAFAEAGAKIFNDDPKRQYMAIIIDDNDHVTAIGYNGKPRGMEHRDEYVIRAESNALLHGVVTRNSKMYLNGKPDFGSAKLIANSGIKELFLKSDAPCEDWAEVHVFLLQAGLRVELI